MPAMPSMRPTKPVQQGQKLFQSTIKKPGQNVAKPGMTLKPMKPQVQKPMQPQAQKPMQPMQPSKPSAVPKPVGVSKMSPDGADLSCIGAGGARLKMRPRRVKKAVSKAMVRPGVFESVTALKPQQLARQKALVGRRKVANNPFEEKSNIYSQRPDPHAPRRDYHNTQLRKLQRGGIAGTHGYKTTPKDPRKAAARVNAEGTVWKSYINGQFVSAATAGATKLKRAVKPGMYKPKTDANTAWIKNVHDQNQAVFNEGMKSKPKVRNGVNEHKVDGLPGGLAGMAWKSGGKKTGTKTYLVDSDAKYLHGKKAMKYINEHETAHVTPKSRTSWRLAAIASNPKKIMREEARADMTSGAYYARGRKELKQADRAPKGDWRTDHGMAQIDRKEDLVDSAASKFRNSGYARRAGSGQERRAAAYPVRSQAGAYAPSSMEHRSAMGYASGRSMREYRKTQNKIARAKGLDKDFRVQKGLASFVRNKRLLSGKKPPQHLLDLAQKEAAKNNPQLRLRANMYNAGSGPMRRYAENR